MPPPLLPNGKEAIGRRVEVYWEDQEEYYQGFIKAHDALKGYFVRYEDGDEQWEKDVSRLKFLDLEQEEEEEKYGHDEYYDDEEQEEEEQSSASLPSVYSHHPNTINTSRKEEDEKEEVTLQQPSSSTASGRHPSNLKQNQHLVGRVNTTSTKGMFCRDKEELVEVKKQLLKEKKQLQQDVSMLEQQVHSKQDLSMSLQTQVKELKAHLLLTNVQPIVTKNSHIKNPQSELEWKDFILDFQLQNKQLTQENQMLKEKMQQVDVSKIEQKLKQMDIQCKKINPLDCVSFMDLQVEMSTLVQEKRQLDDKLKQFKLDKSTNHNKNSKEELETQLEKIELTQQRLQQEKETWQKTFETENAKLLSLQNRLLSLEKALIPFQQSKVLLHSLFQRLLQEEEEEEEEEKEDNNTVHVDVALDAFSMILPKPIDLTKQQFVDKLKNTLEENSQFNKITQLSLQNFIDVFQTLVVQ